jgi:hypothetical protein
LLPAGPAADVTIKVNNPNSFAVTITNVAGNGPITPDTGHPSCTTTGVTFTNQTGLSDTVPANSTNDSIDLAGTASMSANSLSGCQGATFTIPLTVTVQK